MSFPSTVVVAASFTLLLAASAARATPFDVKPGRWETTTVTHMKGVLIPEGQLAKMTPEQRARVEEAMKSQHDRKSTHASCVTKEELERAFLPDEDEEDCKHTVVSSSATKQEVVVECTGETKSKRTMRFEALSPERVKGTFAIVAGKGQATVDFTGRWLSPDCKEEEDGDEK